MKFLLETVTYIATKRKTHLHNYNRKSHVHNAYVENLTCIIATGTTIYIIITICCRIVTCICAAETSNCIIATETVTCIVATESGSQHTSNKNYHLKTCINATDVFICIKCHLHSSSRNFHMQN